MKLIRGLAVIVVTWALIFEPESENETGNFEPIHWPDSWHEVGALGQKCLRDAQYCEANADEIIVSAVSFSNQMARALLFEQASALLNETFHPFFR